MTRWPSLAFHVACAALAVVILWRLVQISVIEAHAATVLLTGWFDFPRRTLPQVTVNPAAIGMVLATSFVALVLMQFLGRALAGERREWRLKWTLLAYASLWLLFAIAIAAGGLGQNLQVLLLADQGQIGELK